ncbi:MAG: cytochrome c-type biogenesis protein CcmH [Myxococcota bacterium]
MCIREFFGAALIALMCVATLPTSAFAQKAPNPGEVSRVTNDVSNEVLSPFCPGKTLKMCTSPNAAEVRRLVQDMAREGKSKEDIKQDILEQFGDEFELKEPPASDNRNLFLALSLSLVFAIAVVALLSNSSKKSALSEANASTNEDEEEMSEEDRAYLDQLRQDLED